jgi:cupin superfamily acireductone dioxygenase involved in methionine salvage
MKSDTKKSSMPEWMGNWPFREGEVKRPVVITREKELSTLYGYEGHQVCSGDEIYYVTQGDPTAFNAEMGEVFQMHQGDALLIPRGTRHQIANFTEKIVKIIATNAPKTWVEDAGGSDIPPVKDPKFYKGKKS